MVFRRYSGDPYWLTTKYAGKCDGCGALLEKLSRAFRFKSGQMFGDKCGCGEKHSREFEALAADEDRHANHYP